MESSIFYQTLSSISFTLLGVWFAVMKFGHGGWLTDPARHRSTLHITLHFLLPGTLGLTSLLGAPGDGGLMWRVGFIIGGVLGTAEAVGFLRDPDGPVGRLQRTLRALDPVLYLGLVATAFVQPKAFALSPQQVGGIANGLVFLAGLSYVWLAFTEWAPEDDGTRRDDRAGEQVTAGRGSAAGTAGCVPAGARR